MNWQDYCAFGLFFVATAFVAIRSYRALFDPAKPGCGSACGSCSASVSLSANVAPKQLLSIDSLPKEPRL